METQTAVLVSTAEVWISAPDTQTPIFLGFLGVHRGAPDSSFRAFSLHPPSDIKNQKSENIKMEPQKWSPWRGTTPVQITEMGSEETLSLKDMRWSGFPWRGNFRDKSQKCFGPRISDFPKLSVTALFWWGKGRRLLGPPKVYTADFGSCAWGQFFSYGACHESQGLCSSSV